MFRNHQHPRNTDENVVTHPDIVEINHGHQETLINFKKQTLQVKVVQQKNKKKNENEEEENEEDKAHGIDVGEEALEDLQTAQAAGEEPNKGKRKPKILPNFLNCSAKYNFPEKSVVMCFWNMHFEWSLVSISGVYDFHNTPILENDFKQITGNDFVYNITPTDSEAKVFKLDVSKIERHILMKKFTINLNYMFLDDKEMQLFGSTYTMDVPHFKTETRMKRKMLGHFHADPRITALYNYKFKRHVELRASDMALLVELDQYQRQTLNARSNGNSTQMIKYALNIEDLSSQEEMKTYALNNIRIEGLMNNYSFNIARNKLPPNFEEMSLCFVPMSKYKEGLINPEDDCIFSQIEKYEHNRIHFEKKFPPSRIGIQRTIDLRETYLVRFIPNRITYRACFQALDSIQQHLLKNFFNNFEDEPTKCSRESHFNFTEFEWYNDQIATNEEQMTAVKSVVNCTAYPFPYVIFGPPGTGKTSCIVECIAQILKLKPRSRIMVTAQSNSACDEVGTRLLKYISNNKIYRFYSPSLLNPQNGETSAELRRTSNLRNEKNEIPTKEEFNHFNVVIVTLMSCSRIVQLDYTDMNRNFDYIFVDECAAATEPEAFVPIIGLGTDFHEITTNIVLLGDHKQLGPVISSDIAARLGLGVSLMERIMSKRRYQMNPSDMSYDKNYVTQLLDNFRSHPAILQFSNVLFYESKLRAKLAEPERSFGTRWNYLNNKKFPVLFHCVKEPSKIRRGETSSYNEGEIKLVRFYVDLLLRVGIDGEKVSQKDIGIVSPYKAQLNMLRDNLRHAKDVEIGTAEYYQGREKKIIIISTVRSRVNVGFLKSEKRLNVCITRAKSLLILVGNANTLQQDSLWNSFMHFCKANDACCGEDFALTRLTEEEEKVLSVLNSVFDQLADNNQAEAQAAIDRAEDLKAIEDRMNKLQELMRRM